MSRIVKGFAIYPRHGGVWTLWHVLMSVSVQDRGPGRE